MRISKLVSLLCFSLLLGSASLTSTQAQLFQPEENEVINPVRDVNQLIYRGKRADALALAEKEIENNPKNVQLRFIRGVILSDLKRNKEAKDAFEELIREYPEIAEPYNNLAVLYAGEGNLGRAKELLEQALSNNAKSFTTYNNLGDVYLALAAQSYGEALKLSPKSKNTKTKLETIRELLSLLLIQSKDWLKEAWKFIRF